MGANASVETHASTKDKHGHSYSAVFEENFFGKTSCRYMFKGTLRGQGFKANKHCITKMFDEAFYKKPGNELVKGTHSWSTSKTAEEFVNVFNSMKILGMRIEVDRPIFAKMRSKEWSFLGMFKGTNDDHLAPDETIKIEMWQDNFEKYNTSSGYESTAHPLMTAFTHWTWCASGRTFMVCDLQGSFHGKQYTLTDPVVHSVEGNLGPADLGLFGMEMVLANHTCNDICKNLELYNPLKAVNIPFRGQSTLFRFEVEDEKQKQTMEEGKSEHFAPVSQLK